MTGLMTAVPYFTGVLNRGGKESRQAVRGMRTVRFGNNSESVLGPSNSCTIDFQYPTKFHRKFAEATVRYYSQYSRSLTATGTLQKMD
jgi:hypothetical protein